MSASEYLIGYGSGPYGHTEHMVNQHISSQFAYCCTICVAAVDILKLFVCSSSSYIRFIFVLQFGIDLCIERKSETDIPTFQRHSSRFLALSSLVCQMAISGWLYLRLSLLYSQYTNIHIHTHTQAARTPFNWTFNSDTFF